MVLISLFAMNTKFEKLIKDIGYKQLSPYVRNNLKVQLQCTKGHIINMTASAIKSGRRCAKCSNKCPEQARKEFEKLIKDIGYKQLSPYINSGKKVKLQCDQDHIINMTPDSIKTGYRCAKCSNKCPEQSKKDFKKLIKDIGYKQLSPYVRNNLKIKLQCTKDHLIEIRASDLKSGVRCAKCAGLCPEQAKQEFENKLFEICYKQLSPYVTATQKVKLQCTNGHIIEMQPNVIKSGGKCIKCANFGYDHNKIGIIYLLKCVDNKYLKIGITNNLNQRLKDHKRFLPFKFNLVDSFSFSCGSKVADLEKELLKTYKKHKALNIKQRNQSISNETFIYKDSLLKDIVFDIKNHLAI